MAFRVHKEEKEHFVVEGDRGPFRVSKFKLSPAMAAKMRLACGGKVKKMSGGGEAFPAEPTDADQLLGPTPYARRDAGFPLPPRRRPPEVRGGEEREPGDPAAGLGAIAGGALAGVPGMVAGEMLESVAPHVGRGAAEYAGHALANLNPYGARVAEPRARQLAEHVDPREMAQRGIMTVASAYAAPGPIHLPGLKPLAGGVGESPASLFDKIAAGQLDPASLSHEDLLGIARWNDPNGTWDRPREIRTHESQLPLLEAEARRYDPHITPDELFARGQEVYDPPPRRSGLEAIQDHLAGERPQQQQMPEDTLDALALKYHNTKLALESAREEWGSDPTHGELVDTVRRWANDARPPPAGREPGTALPAQNIHDPWTKEALAQLKQRRGATIDWQSLPEEVAAEAARQGLHLRPTPDGTTWVGAPPGVGRAELPVFRRYYDQLAEIGAKIGGFGWYDRSARALGDVSGVRTGAPGALELQQQLAGTSASYSPNKSVQQAIDLTMKHRVLEALHGNEDAQAKMPGNKNEARKSAAIQRGEDPTLGPKAGPFRNMTDESYTGYRSMPVNDTHIGQIFGYSKGMGFGEPQHSFMAGEQHLALQRLKNSGALPAHATVENAQESAWVGKLFLDNIEKNGARLERMTPEQRSAEINRIAEASIKDYRQLLPTQAVNETHEMVSGVPGHLEQMRKAPLDVREQHTEALRGYTGNRDPLWEALRIPQVEQTRGVGEWSYDAGNRPRFEAALRDPQRPLDPPMTGPTHAMALLDQDVMPSDSALDRLEQSKGFLDPSGRYLDRREAFKAAQSAEPNAGGYFEATRQTLGRNHLASEDVQGVVPARRIENNPNIASRPLMSHQGSGGLDTPSRELLEQVGVFRAAADAQKAWAWNHLRVKHGTNGALVEFPQPLTDMQLRHLYDAAHAAGVEFVSGDRGGAVVAGKDFEGTKGADFGKRLKVFRAELERAGGKIQRGGVSSGYGELPWGAEGSGEVTAHVLNKVTPRVGQLLHTPEVSQMLERKNVATDQASRAGMGDVRGDIARYRQYVSRYGIEGLRTLVKEAGGGNLVEGAKKLGLPAVLLGASAASQGEEKKAQGGTVGEHHVREEPPHFIISGPTGNFRVHADSLSPGVLDHLRKLAAGGEVDARPDPRAAAVVNRPDGVRLPPGPSRPPVDNPEALRRVLMGVQRPQQRFPDGGEVQEDIPLEPLVRPDIAPLVSPEDGTQPLAAVPPERGAENVSGPSWAEKLQSAAEMNQVLDQQRIRGERDQANAALSPVTEPIVEFGRGVARAVSQPQPKEYSRNGVPSQPQGGGAPAARAAPQQPQQEQRQAPQQQQPGMSWPEMPPMQDWANEEKSIDEMLRRGNRAADLQAQSESAQQQALTGLYDKAHKDLKSLQDDTTGKLKSAQAEIDKLHSDLTDIDPKTGMPKAGIDPNHFWSSQSVWDRVRTGIGLVLSGIGSGLSGQPNLAAVFVQKAIDRDMEAQKAQLGLKQSALAWAFKKYGNVADAANVQKSFMLSTMAAEASMIGARTADPKIRAAAEMAKAEWQKAALASKAQVIVGRNNDLWNRYNTQFQRRLFELSMGAMQGAPSGGNGYLPSLAPGPMGSDPMNPMKWTVEAKRDAAERTLPGPGGTPFISYDKETAQKLRPMLTAAEQVDGTLRAMEQIQKNATGVPGTMAANNYKKFHASLPEQWAMTMGLTQPSEVSNKNLEEVLPSSWDAFVRGGATFDPIRRLLHERKVAMYRAAGLHPMAFPVLQMPVH